MKTDRRTFPHITRRQLLTTAGCAFAVRQLNSQPSNPAAKPCAPPPAQGIHYDNDGLIIHVHTAADGKRVLDGGDTAQREGWYWVGRWIRERVLNDPWPVSRCLDFPAVLRMLEPKQDGIFYRHPKLPPWNNPFDKDFGFSIDQMTPLVAAMGLWGHTTELRRLWNALPQDPIGGTRHTFIGPLVPIKVAGITIGCYYTGDLVFGKFINLFRRSWDEDPMPAADGNGPWGEADLGGLVCLRTHPKDLDDTGDDLNLIVMLLTAIRRHPSNCPGTSLTLPDLPDELLSSVGLKKYIQEIKACKDIRTCTADYVEAYKQRPASYGSYLQAYRQHWGDDSAASDSLLRSRLDEGIMNGWKPDTRTVFGALRWYHRPQIGANPQLADLYDPIIRTYFERKT